ncbi:branched-chain amino acid ABC transporter permease [Ileibacterium valens]|uniref:branched-chain amino acid ABC transporter permease n=1 Tax=Ileibacterium valens TaxID=1862668 RepID=UPI00272FE070|nr:branched-chain amino acid ABC transporter permease [Ileibacterium valens]
MSKNLFSRTNIIWTVLVLVLFALMTLLMQMGIINSYYQSVIFNICINIILAVSLNLIVGICGQFSLGHAGFMAIGAYSAGIITKMIPNYWGMLLGILVGFVISTVAALIVSIPTLRLKGDYLAIATLGFSEIIRICIQNMKITNGAAGLTGIPQLTTWPIFFFCMILAIMICTSFVKSAPGRACIAINDDEIAAEAMGINTTRFKVIAFVVGAILASLAGAIMANYFYVLTPGQFTFNRSIDILVMVVFGGMGSMSASVIAAILIGLLNMYLQQFTDLRMIIYGAALVLMMIFRPQGILGTWEFSLEKLLEKWKARASNKGSRRRYYG